MASGGWFRPPKTSTTTRSTVMTMPITARANRITSRADIFRTWRWRSKKFISGSYRPRSEGDARSLAVPRVLDLEQGRRLEAEHARDEVGREGLALVVVGHDGVVEVLARVRDLVLGGGQLLGELHHVLVRLQVRVRLLQGEQPAQGLGQHVLRAGE